MEAIAADQLMRPSYWYQDIGIEHASEVSTQRANTRLSNEKDK
ncbi:hypothetical protein SAMN06265222_11090 [Neorhodopirellula lusitana]|uniref:Uncharacterized protein n=1 Tax=Neorhodopirellula lusitana TaxID=445327 RepID=A0ABY1QFP6_9BACT|nr:hypothetical protein SAMN06265222_11090 [Neorhodopirellula lusitana]